MLDEEIMNLRWRDSEAHILNVTRLVTFPSFDCAWRQLLPLSSSSLCSYSFKPILLSILSSGALTEERLKSPLLIPLGTVLSSLRYYWPSMFLKLPLSFPLPFYKLWEICLSHVYVVLEWEHWNFIVFVDIFISYQEQMVVWFILLKESLKLVVAVLKVPSVENIKLCQIYSPLG